MQGPKGSHGGSRTRVAVMGAGSIGCYVGGWLATHHDVTLVGRSAVVDTIADVGLTVTDIDGASRTTPPSMLRLSTEASAVTGADVVLVCTKSAGTAAATGQLAPFVRRETILISLQNGLRNAAAIESALEPCFPSRADRPLVLSGMVPFNVVRSGPAAWTQTVDGRLLLKDHPRVEGLARSAREAGLDVGLHPDMRAVLYAKLLLNLNNAVNALSGVPLAQQLRDRDHRRVLAACQDEALAVARAAALSPARLTTLPPGLMPRVLRLPTPVFTALAATQLRISGSARSSMADDVAAGRPTEIGELQGVVAELGERYDVATPVSHALVALVREAERAGQAGGCPHRWGGAELRAAVGV